MKKSLLPVSKLTLIQNAVCLLVMLAVLFLSFGSIFTATVSKSDKAVEIYDSVIDALDEGNENADKPEMPETVEVSVPYIVKSVGSVGKIFKAAIKSAKDVKSDADKINSGVNNINSANNKVTSDDDYGNMLNGALQAQDDIESGMNDIQDGLDGINDAKNDISDTLKNEDFLGLVALIVVVANAFSQNVLLGIVYILLMILSFVLVLTAVIRFIIVLVSFLKNLKDPGKAHSTISKSYCSLFSLFPLLWLLKIIAPAVEFSAGVKAMIVLMIVGLVLNFAASRLKAYTSVQGKYLNVLQGMSVIAVVGYFIFMLNIGSIDFFGHVWDALPNVIKTAKAPVDYLLPVTLVILMIGLMISACQYISKIACRLACMVPAPKTIAGRPVQLAKDKYIAPAAMSLGMVIIPIVLMKSKLALDFGDDMGKFVLFSAGIIIMFVAELLVSILKKSVCAGLTAEDVHAVLTGCPTGDFEADAEEKAETVNETAEAEDEVKSEEAVSEEAAAEEATAEVVEENTADETTSD